MQETLYLYLISSAALFSIGVAIIITKRNAILVLMGIELMLNAANINLVAFASYHLNPMPGQMFVLFTMVIAAAEITVGLAIIIRAYRHWHTIQPDQIKSMKG